MSTRGMLRSVAASRARLCRMMITLSIVAVSVIAPCYGAASALKGGGELYFVPVGPLKSVSTEQLVSYYRVRFGLDIRVLSRIEPAESAADLRRRQLIAERITQFVRTSYPELATGPRTVIIGISEYDMHIQKIANWQFAFSYRDGRVAIVSAARMDPKNFGLPADGELLHQRLRKMITKNLGILYFGLSQTSDPRSVMYNGILGLEELDAIGEDF